MSLPCIWFDLDNSPHVLFFTPLIREVERRGVNVLVTVREFAQTVELAQSHGLKFQRVGDHKTRRSFLLRAGATVFRAGQLAAKVRRAKPTVAISHGSRAQTIAAKLLGIPAMVMFDYEFVSTGVFTRLASRVLLPEAIPDTSLRERGLDNGKVLRYPGFKEEVYIYDFRPNPQVLDQLGLDQQRLIVTVRPPATWAHYYRASSAELFAALMERLRREGSAQVVILPRTAEQASDLQRTYANSFPNLQVLTRSVDALNLMWHSDAVFSGGGTMVREAALLGVPVFSTFGGELGAADAALEAAGRLVVLRGVGEVRSLTFKKRSSSSGVPPPNFTTREFILSEILRFSGIS